MARSFYEDDELVVTKPGFNTEISKDLEAKESLHGNVSFLKGMSIRSTPFLEEKLNRARLYVHDKLSIAEAELGTAVSATKNELQTISNEVSSLIKEPVLPNIIYVLTLTLTGSILVNRRGLPLRFLSPTVFGIGSFSYFMPKSFNETKARITGYEADKFPDLYTQQTKLVEELKTQQKLAADKINHLNDDLASSIHEARLKIKELIDEGKK